MNTINLHVEEIFFSGNFLNIFILFFAEGECDADTCVGLSSGTAFIAPNDDQPENSCTCQCHKHLPAFREDLQICVDDIHGT